MNPRLHFTATDRGTFVLICDGLPLSPDRATLEDAIAVARAHGIHKPEALPIWDAARGEFRGRLTMTTKAMSNRKPHNHLPGYVCELKSHHPKLPGHFVVFRSKDMDLDCGDCRYAVAHMPTADTMGALVGVGNLPSARAVMKDMAAGGNVADFGQHDTNYFDE